MGPPRGIQPEGKKKFMQLCSMPDCQKPWCGTFSRTSRCSTPGCQERSYNGNPRSFCSASCAQQTALKLASAITEGDEDQLFELIQSLDGVRNRQVEAKIIEAKQLLQVTLTPRVASNENHLVNLTFTNLAGDEVADVSANHDMPLTKLWEMIANKAGVHKWQIVLLLWGECALLESDIAHSCQNVADLLRDMTSKQCKA